MLALLDKVYSNHESIFGSLLIISVISLIVTPVFAVVMKLRGKKILRPSLYGLFIFICSSTLMAFYPSVSRQLLQDAMQQKYFPPCTAFAGSAIEKKFGSDDEILQSIYQDDAPYISPLEINDALIAAGYAKSDHLMLAAPSKYGFRFMSGPFEQVKVGCIIDISFNYEHFNGYEVRSVAPATIVESDESAEPPRWSIGEIHRR